MCVTELVDSCCRDCGCRFQRRWQRTLWWYVIAMHCCVAWRLMHPTQLCWTGPPCRLHLECSAAATAQLALQS
eukprot:3576184-Amphidinium_carterae.1